MQMMEQVEELERKGKKPTSLEEAKKEKREKLRAKGANLGWALTQWGMLCKSASATFIRQRFYQWQISKEWKLAVLIRFDVKLVFTFTDILGCFTSSTVSQQQPCKSTVENSCKRVKRNRKAMTAIDFNAGRKTHATLRILNGNL